MELSDLSGGIAVITGAGSVTGLGFALAKKAASLGMHIVLSDVRQAAVDEAVDTLRPIAPTQVEGCVCDVTEMASVERLLVFTTTMFAGFPIRFVGANAGVFFPKTTILSGTTKEWEKTYQVNVVGLFHTLRVFVPYLISQPAKSAVEITASYMGIMNGGGGPYGTSKQAAIGVAEALKRELEAAGQSEKIAVVALCPGIVTTGLLQTSQGATDIDGLTSREGDAHSERTVDVFKAMWNEGMSANFCAHQLFDHLSDGRFYCFLNESKADSESVALTLTSRYEAMTNRRMEPTAVVTADTKARL